MSDVGRRRAASVCTRLCLVLLAAAAARADLPFEHVVIDPANPSNPHCKTVGDIDGDGLLDAIVASSSGGGMFWYEFPDWTKHTVRASGSWTTDMQLGDVDGDGDLDAVIPNSDGIHWYENPRPLGDPRTDAWTEHLIGASGANHHDVVLGDIEPDGDLDVVTRGKGSAPAYLWRQGPANTWSRVTVQSSVAGEGSALGDIDQDGDLDVAQGGYWVEQVSPTSWTVHTIDADVDDDTGVEIADVDGNGDPDVIIGPSESGSGKLSWYTALDPRTGPWSEYSIDASVSYLHTFKAADMDNDGDLDLVTAEMHQSSNPDEVSIYFNSAGGTAWKQQVVGESGSHNLRVGDIGGDGDLDIFGANWNDSAPNSAVVEYWENTMAPLSLGKWTRHIVETDLPWRSPFVLGQDLNGDALPDLIAGGWWYPNPGTLSGTWKRQTIGAPLNNVALARDLDRDGDLDLLGTDGDHSGEDFSWASNDGGGSFTNFPVNNTAMGGDFLQGVSIGQVEALGQDEIVLSWHNGGTGTALLEVPDDPSTLLWPLTIVSASTNQEAVPMGDLDGDGDTDIHQGDFWLRQEANRTFSQQSGVALSSGVPDRVVLADVDGDEDLDVVIGIEFGAALVWGENDGAGGGWTEHPIADDFDYFSVDARDMDGDGDIDVVGGAHQGSGEVSIYENDGTGLSWTTHVVDSGDSSAIDHHDGTQILDMDLDGDLDIISVGWTKKSLVIYENRALGDGASGGDSERPRLESVTAAASDRVVVDFSEEVLAASAENQANYAISGGVAVNDATLADSQRSVTLTTSALSPLVGYTLTVDNVADLAGNAIAAGTTADFELGLGDPEPGLVAYWPFDRGGGGVAFDASGNGHTGFLAGGAEWGPGPSVDLDGLDDYVDVGSFDVPGGALTLAAWVRADGFGNCSSRDCRIISKTTSTAEADHYFMLSTISSGAETRLRFRLKTGGATTTLIASSGALPVGEWIHVAAVYDGSTMELFLDGASVGSTAKSGAMSTNDAIPVWIGGNPTESSSKPWHGQIDEVRVYSRALSGSELAALPPPSVDGIHADGFESGSLAAWSRQRVGTLQVISAAGRIGTRGLRVTAGSSCAGAEEVTIEPPPPTFSGSGQACRLLSVSGIEIVAPGAELTAGEKITLSDGVSASADLILAIDSALTPYSWIRDDSPSAETAYVADFHVNLGGLVLGPADRLEHFVAKSEASEMTFRLVIQSDGGGGEEVFLEARLGDGSVVTTPAGQETAVSPGWHRWRVSWAAGSGSGYLSLTIDEVLAAELTGLANGSRRVDSVDWGVAGGDLGATSGAIDLDGFSSWRPAD